MLTTLDSFISRYRAVSSGAACLWTHWPIFTNLDLTVEDFEGAASAVTDYFTPQLPPACRQRRYFDHDPAGLDAFYPPFQVALDRRLPARGCRPDVDWVTRRFPGATHDENACRWRAHLSPGFLLTGRLLESA